MRLGRALGRALRSLWATLACSIARRIVECAHARGGSMMGVAGGSYGGYVTNWLIEEPLRADRDH